MNYLVAFFVYIGQLDWVEIFCRAVFLITCIAIGTWIGS